MAKNKYVGKHRLSNVGLTLDDIRNLMDMRVRMAARRESKTA